MEPHALSLQYRWCVVTQVDEGLVDRGRNFKPEPSLATSWERGSTTSWRLRLRQGASFHDSASFTADDAMFSIESAKSRTSWRASQLRTAPGHRTRAVA